LLLPGGSDELQPRRFLLSLPGMKEAMTQSAADTSFLCTLPGAGKGIAYHVTVTFTDAEHPGSVRFTSFVGDGRRSFSVRAMPSELSGVVECSSERLCRVAIGQAIRDHLYAKETEGDFVLDGQAEPWRGELKPVGSRSVSRVRHVQFLV
jgi:hypothetical protein